jgi:serine phosphatase RsbU (regulator of sigma subunit)
LGSTKRKLKSEMNKNLQNILEIIQQSEKLDTGQKDNLIKAIKEADKELEITSFKLDRTEKVKKTTAILLEETIEELEQKRKAVEVQNRELEIETALERVRAIALGMKEPADMLEVCRVISNQLIFLGVKNIRNVQTAIIDEEKGTYLNYQYFSAYDIKIFEETKFYQYPKALEMAETMKKSADAFFSGSMTGEELVTFREWRKKDNQFPDPLLDETTAVYYNFYSIGPGGLGLTTYNKLPEANLKIFKRFHNVFTLAYRRFIDIEKAIAQAREAQIELALERVRAKTMAMHKSEELKEVIQVVYEQFVHLNINIEHTGFIVDYKASDDMHIWLADQNGAPSEVTIPYFDSPHWNSFIEAKEKGKNLFANLLPFKEKNKFYKKLFTFIPDLPEKSKEFYLSCPGLAISTVLLENVGLYIENFSGIPYSDVENALLMRFGKVFQQTYTRFLDLKKSEAQAREAKIEAALERVRSLALGMRNSEEVGNVTDLLFTELTKLSVDVIGCSIVVIDQDNDKMELWRARSNIAVKPFDSTSFAESMDLLKKYMPEWFPIFIKALTKRKNYLLDELSANRRSQFINAIAEQYKYSGVEKSQLLNNAPEKITTHYIFFKLGYLGLLAEKKLSDENLSLAKRFIEVFDFAYTRFLDIKKAETQAREAQIEAALERVRSKAMAMHNSDDLAITVDTFFSELNGLNVTPHRCGVGIMDEKLRTVDISANTTTKTNKIKKVTGKLKLSGHPILSNIFKHWKFQKEYHPVLHGKEIVDYYKVMNPQITFPDFAGDEIQYGYYFFFKEGGVFAWTDNELTEGDLQIFRRYTSVLSLTYRRYIDLKEAETQAREAKIETALEKVRSKAMSMQSSEDLSATVNVFFKELKTLDIIPIRCGVGKIDEATRTTSLTTTTSSQQGESFKVIGKVEQTGHPVLDRIFENWILQKEYHPVLEGSEIKTYYGVMNKQIPYPDYPEDITQYGNIFYFKEGFVFAWTQNKLSEDELQIFRRFTSVLSLTYRRYLDLQQAELRAREAEQQASLDRVRAEIASMRTTDDLEKITPIIWRELTTLGVPFFRCGVFIFDESISVAHAYLSTPLGKSLAALHVKIDKTWLENAVKHWRQGKIYNEVWDQEQFIAWTQTMIDQGFVESKEQFQAGKKAPDILYLQLLPFTQGMLYVGSKLQLTEEEIETAQKLADDFGVAYSRYEDFKKLEYANHRKSIELEEARQLQLAMLPNDIPQLPHLEIAVYMKTATEVGGDYYDFSFKEDGSINIAIGDATGHGMKAGIMVSSMKSIFTTNSSKMDIESFFTTANSGVKSMGLKRMMMGFTLLNINQDKFNLINAGMPPAFWYQKKRKKVEEIKEHGMPIGAMSLSKYNTKNGVLEKGDVLLLLTDGMPELHNEKNELYGYERLLQSFKQIAEKEPQEIVDQLKNIASQWANEVEPDDDVTFVVIKVK